MKKATAGIFPVKTRMLYLAVPMDLYLMHGKNNPLEKKPMP
jgi:hypothetical protein